MSNKTSKGPVYYAYAIIGWFVLLIGAGAIVLAIISSGDPNARFKMGLGGLSASIIGILLARRADKNIFRALDEVLLFII